MNRPIYVRQHENHDVSPPVFWYTVGRGNGQPTLTSETYRERSKAIRAARSTIALFDPARVVEFTYRTGRYGAMAAKTERH